VAHHVKEAVEDEDRIVGQAVLGKRREAAQVAEEDRDLAFAPALRQAPAELRG